MISTIKFKALSEDWFEQYANLNLKRTTLTRQRQLTKRIYKSIGHIHIDKRSELHDRARFCLFTGEGSYQQFEKSRQQTMTYLVFKSLQTYVQRELRQAAVRELSVSSK